MTIKYHISYNKTNFLSLRMHLLHKTYTYTVPPLEMIILSSVAEVDLELLKHLR